jgi:iron-sulfur cluster assembly protein
MPAITLSEKAVEAVRSIMSKTLEDEAGRTDKDNRPKIEKLYLRVRVVGGGCSGFSNKLDLDAEVNDKLDEVFECSGVPVVVDRRSLMYLEGAKIDYHDEPLRSGFSIHNPNAKSTCGCGSSWSM